MKADRCENWWTVYDDDGRIATEFQMWRTSGGLGVDKDAWSIWSVETRDDYRRKGLARALLSRALLYASRKGQKKVRLNVYNDNSGARKLYESLGFRYISNMGRHTLEMEVVIDRSVRQKCRQWAAQIP